MNRFIGVRKSDGSHETCTCLAVLRMAKGLRSNNKKALRTVRRQKLVENPEWLADAEAKRQEVMARVLAGDKPTPPEPGMAGMDVEAAQPPSATAASAPAAAATKPKGRTKAKMVTSTGKVHLTKKKALKLRKKQAAGNDLWKQTGAMSFHSKKMKRTGGR